MEHIQTITVCETSPVTSITFPLYVFLLKGHTFAVRNVHILLQNANNSSSSELYFPDFFVDFKLTRHFVKRIATLASVLNLGKQNPVFVEDDFLIYFLPYSKNVLKGLLNNFILEIGSNILP